jgi:hypothetical protein
MLYVELNFRDIFYRRTLARINLLTTDFYLKLCGELSVFEMDVMKKEIEKYGRPLPPKTPNMSSELT